MYQRDKRKMRLQPLLIGIFLLQVSICSAEGSLSISKNNAAEKWNWILILEGEIRYGDSARVAEFIRAQKSWPSSIMLNDIPGGSVLEALKIADIIEQSLTPLNVAGICASACIYLVVAANERRPFDLGVPSSVKIHRPFFSREEFANLPRREAESLYQQAENDLRRFLQARNVPVDLQELIFSIPSNESLEVSSAEFISRIGKYHRPFEEWLISKCGDYEMTSDEEADFGRLTNAWIESWDDENSSFDESPEGRYFNLLTEKSKRHESCKDSALAAERRSTFWEFAFSDLPE